MFSNLKEYSETHKMVEHKTENACNSYLDDIFIGLWQHSHGNDGTSEHRSWRLAIVLKKMPQHNNGTAQKAAACAGA